MTEHGEGPDAVFKARAPGRLSRPRGLSIKLNLRTVFTGTPRVQRLMAWRDRPV